jgi:two-component system CheB/CheR fusion protein
MAKRKSRSARQGDRQAGTRSKRQQLETLGEAQASAMAAMATAAPRPAKPPAAAPSSAVLSSLAALSAPLPSVLPATPSSIPPHAGRALRIMLVEDHRDTASLMARVLARSGHQVELARSVRDALGLADRRLDVVISDLGLPDGDGCDLMRQLAPTGARGIALSGLVSEKDVQRCREARFVEHVAKPVNINVLLWTIRHVAESPPPVAPPR